MSNSASFIEAGWIECFPAADTFAGRIARGVHLETEEYNIGVFGWRQFIENPSEAKNKSFTVIGRVWEEDIRQHRYFYRPRSVQLDPQ